MSDDSADDVRATLRGIAADAPALMPDLGIVTAGGRHRFRRRHVRVAGTVAVVLVATGGVGVVVARSGEYDRAVLVARPTPTMSPGPVGEDEVFGAADGAWTVSTRRSQTGPGLVCQTLARQGAVATTRTTTRPATLVACAPSDTAYASFHRAYIVRPADRTGPATVEFGRAPAGTVAVRLTGAGGRAIEVKPRTVDGVEVWAAEVRRRQPRPSR